MDIYLETKSGKVGRVIDIMVDEEFDGKNQIMLLLEFEDEGDIDWFVANDLEPCDYAFTVFRNGC